MKNRIGTWIKLYLGLMFAFLACMTLVNMIPNGAIDTNVQISLTRLAEEGDYPSCFYGTSADQVDNRTDIIMLEKIEGDGFHSVLWNAMSVNQYPRYWHGYQIFLRPLLMKFTIVQIRLISTFAFFGLLTGAVYTMAKRINFWTGLLYMMTIVSANILIIPCSMQFVSCFNIMSAALIVLMCNKKITQSKSNALLYFFFTVGAVTNFMDLLTVPLITLGIPLAATMLIFSLEQKEMKLGGYMRHLLTSSMAWGIGYGLTWVTKWILAAMVTGQNMFADTYQAIVFCVKGDKTHLLDRLTMLKNNIANYLGLHAFSKKELLCMLFLMILVLIVSFLLGHRRDSRLKVIVPLIVIAVYPFIWYNILVIHAQIYCLFTYRTQMITFFSVGAAVIAILDGEKIKAKLCCFGRKIPKGMKKIFEENEPKEK